MSGFAGEWIQKNQEGYEEFMKLMGVPEQYIEANKNATVSLDIEENGDKFSIKTTRGTQSWIDEFEIGKPAMITGPGQKKLETTVSRDGNKLIGNCATPKATITVCRALDGNLLYDTETYGKVIALWQRKRGTGEVLAEEKILNSRLQVMLLGNHG